MEIWTIIGVIFVIIVFSIFTKQLGKSIPILELMLLVAGLQWIIGPLIEYVSPTFHYKYYMYVDESEYMSFVVPAYIVFSAAILLGLNKKDEYKIPLDDLKNYSKLGIYFIVLGFIADFALGFLGFFGFILANLKYVGAIILYFSPNKNYRIAFYVIIILLLIQSLSNALFHDFILWSVFFYMFWTYKYKPSLRTKLGTFVLAVVLMASLQSVKSAYRAQVWSGYSGNKVELFATLIYNDLFGATEESKETINGEVSNNVRLNQGWIISAIMNEVPLRTDFFEGSTVLAALESALLPRFLAPNKAEAGGRENFRKFTGLYISDGTSMGISIVGEAYGNFGIYGGIFFMGIWGFFILKVWQFLINKSKDQIVLLAFLPLIFLQVVKAETELVVVLNHLIKTGIAVLIILYVIRSIDLEEQLQEI